MSLNGAMGLWVGRGVATIPLPEVTRGEGRQKQGSLGLVRHLGVGSALMLHPCSLEMEYSLHGHTTWYGRRPSMTWMWSPAGSTQPSAARIEIFGGHPFLRPSDHIPSCPRGSALGSSALCLSFCPGLCAPLSLQNEHFASPKRW